MMAESSGKLTKEKEEKEGDDWRPFSLKNSGFWLISRVGKGKRFLRFPYICAHENKPELFREKDRVRIQSESFQISRKADK